MPFNQILVRSSAGMRTPSIRKGGQPEGGTLRGDPYSCTLDHRQSSGLATQTAPYRIPVDVFDRLRVLLDRPQRPVEEPALPNPSR